MTRVKSGVRTNTVEGSRQYQREWMQSYRNELTLDQILERAAKQRERDRKRKAKQSEKC